MFCDELGNVYPQVQYLLTKKEYIKNKGW
jgi:hypothetical protein